MTHELNDEDEAKLAHSGVVSFTYTPWSAHVREFLRNYWLPTLLLFFAALGVLVTLVQTFVDFGGSDIRPWLSYWRLLATSLAVSLVWNVYSYLQRVPDGLEGASKTACWIGNMRRPKWQFKLAQVLLIERLSPLDQELDDLKNNAQFVDAYCPDSFSSYVRWISSRPANLVVMSTVWRSVVVEFVAALHSSVENPIEPKSVVVAVNRLVRFYSDTVAFERANRAVMPIESLQTLHSLVYNWSDSIRDGIIDLFNYLGHLSSVDPRHSPPYRFEVELKLPPEMDLLNKAIRDLEGRTDLLEGW